MYSSQKDLERDLEEIREILAAGKGDYRSLLYRQMIINCLRCKNSNLDILDLKVINRAVAEFCYAARMFLPYRDTRKVSMFGSARVNPQNSYYQMAVKLGRALSENGFMTITGAAEGIMCAGIEGAGVENSFGVNILLPFEKGPTRIIRDDPKVARFKYFFIRKIFFVMEADAIALFPGGFGTMDEGFEVLTLLQTGKAPPMPVLLMEFPGERYWERWQGFVEGQLLDKGYIFPEDTSFFTIVNSSEEAIGYINDYYSTYHSMRQVGPRLIIRMEKALSDESMEELNSSFSDLLESGRITRTMPAAGESDEPELSKKPRIAFRNNKKSAGRLNQLVLKINELGKSQN